MSDTEKDKVEAEQNSELIVEVEKEYSTSEVVGKLRRLADALEAEKTFEIQIAGERIYVPPYAKVEFEYESDGENEEIEIELKWKK